MMMPSRVVVPPARAATAVSPEGGSAHQAGVRSQQVSSDAGAKLPTVLTQGIAGQMEAARRQGAALASVGLAGRQAGYSEAAEALQASQVLGEQQQRLAQDLSARARLSILAQLPPEHSQNLRQLPAMMRQAGLA